MIPPKSQSHPVVTHRLQSRDRALIYGLVVSIVGLPVGIALGLPVVWGLAILGILIGSFKLYHRPIER
ncbi:MAG: hypothetical protein IT425_05830 [Pirellulales bacterium]|nr:hypothetical protein [Pirellulales bacterium]